MSRCNFCIPSERNVHVKHTWTKTIVFLSEGRISCLHMLGTQNSVYIHQLLDQRIIKDNGSIIMYKIYDMRFRSLHLDILLHRLRL